MEKEKKKALCVGINNFKNYPSAALQGCVNDAHDMKTLLIDFFGYDESDIVLLADDQATKSNIMSHLQSMVDGAKSGEYQSLLFSLSSHGTQVPDLSGDEPDQADEAFCPHDLKQKENYWDPAYIITDDELHDLFVTLPENVLLEVFLDTCHSGTGIRAIDLLLDRKPRYMPPPSFAAFSKVDGRSSRGISRGLLESGITRHILWTGCRADQTSADAKLNDSWHGAFTYYFVKAVRDCSNSWTRKEIIKKVREDLAASHFTQVPQLESEATSRSKEMK